jgi:hypothetical protein
MKDEALIQPRTVPGMRAPAIGGTIVILVALPVFVIGGWPLEAWGIAAALWAANLGIGLLLVRVPREMSSLAGAGVVAFGGMFRAAGLMTILILIAVKDSTLGLPAAIVYGIAFTVELVVGIVAYSAQGETAR